MTDPNGDDNGPGNYAYPTSDNFKPGAYDVQDFQVYDDGTNITFRAQTRDLTWTFASPLGAQLVDVYIHDPGAATHPTRRPRRPQIGHRPTYRTKRVPAPFACDSGVGVGVGECATTAKRQKFDVPSRRNEATNRSGSANVKVTPGDEAL